MNENALETYEHNGHTIQIDFDPEPTDPREWDNLGTMVHWHNRYVLGDRGLESDEREAMERGGFPLLERYMRMVKGAVAILPLSIYDHSGVSMWVGAPYSDSYRGWDSSFIGFIYTTKEAIAEIGSPEDAVEEILRGEVEDYNKFLTGQIFGYRVFDENEEEIDSCWGFFDEKDAKAEAEAIAA